MMWLPIETAPQDGTEFLAYDAKAEKMDVCKWSLAWGVVPVQSDGEYGPLECEFGYETGAITHWMPLPANPDCASQMPKNEGDPA